MAVKGMLYRLSRGPYAAAGLPFLCLADLVEDLLDIVGRSYDGMTTRSA
jgi:hypothetical protein